MASYRPFPPPPQQQQQQPFPPNPNQPLPPPPPRGPSSNPFSHHQQQQQNLNYGRLQPPYSAAPFSSAPHQQPQQQFPYQPPPTAYNLPPPPPSYFPPSSQFHNFPQQQQQSAPPPPPLRPASPPPLPPPAQAPAPPPPPAQHEKDRLPGTHNHSHSKHAPAPPRPQKGVPPPGAKAAETEEERRMRKRREYEKQRQEEKRRMMMKESQVAMLQKTQMLAAGMKQHPHGSLAGSRLMDRKAGPFLSAERVENRLKKPTTFLCKFKFRNELPDPTAQPKLLAMNADKDRYTKYAISSLEKMHKPKLYLEPDLGIPLDLLDISIYNPPKKCPPLAPEDEELLRDTAVVTPIKPDGIRRKERPTDKGVAWLVKTQYISSLSMDSHRTPLSEKQAKEQRDAKEGRNSFLETLNNREKQIQAIEESFKAAKLRPVHQTNPKLEPVDIFPLLPDMDRYDDQFVIASFDGDPTAESEMYNKLDKSIRSEFESQAIMKSFVVTGSDPTKPEKFLSYMVPSPHEFSKDIYDEAEDISYSWVREYHWEVRGDNADDPTTYLVSFDKECARYLPLPTKLILQKKKAKEGRSADEVEHYPVPSRVTVRRRPTVAISEMGPNRNASNHVYGSSKVNMKRGNSPMEEDEDNDAHYKHQRVEDMDQYSGEEDMSG